MKISDISRHEFLNRFWLFVQSQNQLDAGDAQELLEKFLKYFEFSGDK